MDATNILNNDFSPHPHRGISLSMTSDCTPNKIIYGIPIYTKMWLFFLEGKWICGSVSKMDFILLASGKFLAYLAWLTVFCPWPFPRHFFSLFQTWTSNSCYSLILQWFSSKFCYSTPWILARCLLNHNVQFCKFKNAIFGPPDDGIYLDQTALIIHTCIWVTKKKSCNSVGMISWCQQDFMA